MKKKFLSLVCMIACIFGLSACGSEEVLTEYEQQKVENAKIVASSVVIPMFADGICQDIGLPVDEYTPEEMETLCAYLANEYGLSSFMADGNAAISGRNSFSSALKTIGDITGVGEANAEIDGDQIIVRVEVTGEKKNAEAEIIFSNDMYLKLESAALNPSASMGELMQKAALNTVIGMGTVFLVLIFISLIISCFRFIPKLQAKLTRKKETDKSEGIGNTVAQIAEQEKTETEETDDLELVAVIAAAIAASEGAASTDGFVVRSIRRRREAY